MGTNPFSVGGGVLTITAASGANSAGRPYSSGVIDSKAMFSQTYGYFEMRAELPAGAGMCPAFWTQDANDCAAREIDAMEAFGAPNASGEGGPHSMHWDVYDISNPSGTGAWVPTLMPGWGWKHLSGAAAADASNADTLTLLMSEDAYLGDAQAVVTIDKAVGGAVTVTASHSQGKTQAVTLAG